MTSSTQPITETHGRVDGTITLRETDIKNSIELLRNMLENKNKVDDTSVDNIRGQIGMLRKILRREFPLKPPRESVKVPERPPVVEEGERAALYGVD